MLTSRWRVRMLPRLVDLVATGMTSTPVEKDKWSSFPPSIGVRVALVDHLVGPVIIIVDILTQFVG